MASFDSLDKTFDVKPEDLPVLKKKAKPLIVSDKSEDKERDYQYARAKLIDIVEKMNEALDGALEVAQQSDHPRAYEVALNGAKSASEVVEKLTDLHGKMKSLEVEETKVVNQTQNNVFMTGSTSELMKMLKETQKENK